MRSASPLEGKTTDRRAGCGRPASPVRREGGPGNRFSLPLFSPHVLTEMTDSGAGHDGRHNVSDGWFKRPRCRIRMS
jgi:hypothetical protein